MDGVLGNELLEFVTVYVDDILIASQNWSEHCDRIERVLNKLNNRNVAIKLEKSILITQRVKFLG